MTANEITSETGNETGNEIWVDSHCHVAECEGGADAAIERARDAGVATMVVVGTDLTASRVAVELAAKHSDVVATVGLHPHYAQHVDEQWEELLALAQTPGVVAIGETGFDLFYKHSDPEIQEIVFRQQIRLAHELDLALVIHTRDAWSDTWRVLREEKLPTRTVFHCFSGGPDEVRTCLDLGAYISFSGIVSFRNADDLRAAAAACPLDRVLVETDAPFLSPEPFRGRPNEPARVGVVGAALAEAMNRPVSAVATATSQAAADVFRMQLTG